jgi:mannitol/fructose-specific phosphotransferase system IIA component (Ntr-type)
MNSESSKPIAGLVAEHGFWPAERRYSSERDTVGPVDSWDPGVRCPQSIVLGDLLVPGRIKVPLVGATRQEVVKEMVDLFVAAGDLGDSDQVLAAIVGRERTRSTGIGGGVAIPHAKTSQVSDVVMAVGLCAEAVDFDSIDGVGVRLVVMLISPEVLTPQHLQVLRSVTDVMSLASIRDELLGAKSADVLYDIFRRHEAAAA